LGLGAYIKNRITTFCRVPHGEITAKKWLDSIEKQKRRIDLKEQRDRHTDRVNDKTRMVQLPATAAIEYVAAGHIFPGGL